MRAPAAAARPLACVTSGENLCTFPARTIIIFVMNARLSRCVVSTEREDSPRRTAVWAAGTFIAGIFAHRLLPPAPPVYLSILAGCCCVAAAGFRLSRLCTAALVAGLFFAALSAAQLESYYFPADHIACYASPTSRFARLEAEVLEPPRVLSDRLGQGRAARLPPRQIAMARVRRVQLRDGRWTPSQGDVLLELAEPHPRLAEGQTVRALGLIQCPGEPMNPGEFDWADHYRQQRIAASVQVPQADNLEIVAQRAASQASMMSWASPPSLVLEARSYVRRILALGFTAGQSLDHALLRALLLGDRDAQLHDVKESFRQSGTGHHLAISGMHVAILGGLVALLCRLLCLSPRSSLAIAMGFIVVYGMIALPSPPVVRSVLLCGAYAFGRTHRRSTDALQLLAVCALAMLVIAPLDVYSAGFQLSYFTVAGLALFTASVKRRIEGLRSQDDRVLETMVPASGAQRLRRFAWRHGSEILAAGAVAWLVSAPLIAFHFQQVNPWAMPGSILLAPIVLIALVGGMLKVLLTLLWPSAAGIWAEAATWPMIAMRHSVDGLAALPGADVPLAAHWKWVFLFAPYALLLLARLAPGAMASAARGRWLRQLPAIATCCMIPLLPILLGVSSPNRAKRPPSLRITALAVGAGSCNVVEMPDGSVALVDCGSNSLSDLTRSCLAPFLRYFGHAHVDRVFLSHANYDHFSAAEDIVDAFDVGEIFVSPAFVEDARDNPSAAHMLRSIRNFGCRQTLLNDGMNVELPGGASGESGGGAGGGARVQVLWPPADRVTLSANDSSMVVRLTYGGRSVLFTGDIESAAERELLKNPSRLKSDILIAPHHGSLEPTTLAFVRAVSPRCIVSSNDRTLSMKQKQFDEVIRAERIPHYRTHASGAVTIELSRDGEVEILPYVQKRQQTK